MKTNADNVGWAPRLALSPSLLFALSPAMSTSPVLSKPAGSSLWRGKPARPPFPVVLNLDELLQGEESAEYTDSEVCNFAYSTRVTFLTD